MFAGKKDIQKLGRLKKRSDFLCVQQNGRKWISKAMVVEIRPNETLGVRYGLTVSKKVSKLAVMRNRIKRRLRAVAFDVLPQYDGQNFDVVLVGRAGADARPYEDLQNDLRWCLRKMGIENPRTEKTGEHREKTAD